MKLKMKSKLDLPNLLNAKRVWRFLSQKEKLTIMSNIIKKLEENEKHSNSSSVNFVVVRRSGVFIPTPTTFATIDEARV